MAIKVTLKNATVFYFLFFSMQSNGPTQHVVESQIRKKLDSLLKESQIVDKEDTDSFSIRALLRATHEGLHKNLSKVDLHLPLIHNIISTSHASYVHCVVRVD